MNPLHSLKNKRILLASKSPRRKELLKGLSIDFTIVSINVKEDYNKNLKGKEITEFLSNKKANAFKDLKNNDLLITADTIVWHNNRALEKPKNRDQAIRMLQELSGKTHQVFTSVTVKSTKKTITFSDETLVTLSTLNSSAIEFYIDEFKPFDKAGSYGIQEWFGFTSIEKIEGSFFNVMGLPTQKLYVILNEF